MEIKFNEREPIYLQIIERIKQDIVQGALKGGDKLPAVREMAESLKVNHNTILRVYQELERENITFTQRGLGSYITEDSKRILDIRKELAQESLSIFVHKMKSLDFTDDEIICTITEHLKV
ncbi:MAG TPA: GntR family transcriptional regulator [Clostridia bacterium]|nr:GntR family transcriptional regulator [Clostridia bacterium]